MDSKQKRFHCKYPGHYKEQRFVGNWHKCISSWGSVQEQHLDFLAIFESASKFTELLHGTFDLSDKHCSVFFSLVCALFLRNEVWKKCVTVLWISWSKLETKETYQVLCYCWQWCNAENHQKVMTLQCLELARITFKLCLLTCILEGHAFLVRGRPSDSKPWL